MKKNILAVSLDSLVPISCLNQGKANKIMADLKGDAIKIVIKNNEPIAAILSLDRLKELISAENRLAALTEREKNG